MGRPSKLTKAEQQLDELVKREMRRQDLWAIHISGANKIVPRSFEDNMGVRPVRVGKTRALEDNISAALDSHSPLFSARVWYRFWTTGKDGADILHGYIETEIMSRSEPLRKGWYGLREDTDPVDLYTTLYMGARETVKFVLDDNEIVGWLHKKVRDGMRQERTP